MLTILALHDGNHPDRSPSDLDLSVLILRFKFFSMKEKVVQHSTSSNAVYCLGFIGAAIYYISVATSFWMGAFGILKAFVWPAFLVYEALKQLGG